MTQPRSCIRLVTLIVLVLAPALAEAVSVRRLCKRLCRPAIAACRLSGYTKASCKRVLTAECMATGGALCVFVPPDAGSTTTTTTTLAGATTTTLAGATTTTTTTVPVTCGSLHGGQIENAIGRSYGIVSSDQCGLYPDQVYPQQAYFAVASCSDGSIIGTYNSPFGTVNVAGTFNGSRYALSSGPVPTGDCTATMTLDIPILRDALGYITINGQCGAYSCVTSYRGETYLP